MVEEKIITEERVLEIDKLKVDGLLSEDINLERIKAKSKHQKLLFREEIKWKQRAKFTWAMESDGNTRLFYRIVN